MGPDLNGQSLALNHKCLELMEFDMLRKGLKELATLLSKK